MGWHFNCIAQLIALINPQYFTIFWISLKIFLQKNSLFQERRMPFLTAYMIFSNLSGYFLRKHSRPHLNGRKSLTSVMM